MRTFDCPQLSPEWWDLRRGIPTASQFGRILTPKTMKVSTAAEEFIHELIAERVRLDPPILTEQPMTPAMRHGVECEPEARKYYEMDRNVDTQLIGFCLTDDGRFGCSPDAIVGEDGLLELKCVQPKTQVAYLMRGVVPPEYKAQVHGQLIVTGRQWVDFLSYCAGFNPLLIRVTPDAYTEALRAALEEFYGHYQAAWEQFQKVNA